MIGNILGQLGVDKTLWFQFALFLVVYFFLRKLYFQPFLALLEWRKSNTVDKVGEAQKSEALALEKEKECEKLLSAVKQKARESGEVIWTEAKNKVSAQAEEARKKNKKKIEEARTNSARNAKESAQELEPSVQKISHLFLDKLIKGETK